MWVLTVSDEELSQIEREEYIQEIIKKNEEIINLYERIIEQNKNEKHIEGIQMCKRENIRGLIILGMTMEGACKRYGIPIEEFLANQENVRKDFYKDYYPKYYKEEEQILYAVEFITNKAVLKAIGKADDEVLEPIRNYYSKHGVGIKEERKGYFVTHLEEDASVIFSDPTEEMQYLDFWDYFASWTFEGAGEQKDIIASMLNLFEEDQSQSYKKTFSLKYSGIRKKYGK